MDLRLANQYGERIIARLDRPSGQLKSTLHGLYRLPYFVYTGLFSTPAGTLFYTGILADEGHTFDVL